MNLRSAIVVTGFLIAGSCGGYEPPDLAFRPGSVLYLARSHVSAGEAADERRAPAGPARLEIYRVHGDHWHQEIVEDSATGSFSKAVWYTPPEGEPGILTIEKSSPPLRIWRKHDDAWESRSLWNPMTADTRSFSTDFELADVTGDGIDDIIIASRSGGRIVIASWQDGAYRIEEIPLEENAIVTDIEVGDIDDDGTGEIFFASRDTQGNGDGVRSGAIGMISIGRKERNVTWIGRGTSFRAGDLLCASAAGESRQVLFCSIEGDQADHDISRSDGAAVTMYRIEEGGITAVEIARLPGGHCHHLDFGDTDGDGTGELIASTPDDGIWKLRPAGTSWGPWNGEQIISGSSGDEHAFVLQDFDGDGSEEIYVASDDQIQLRCYWYTGGEYTVELLGMFAPRTTTSGISAHRFEAEGWGASGVHEHAGSHRQ